MSPDRVELLGVAFDAVDLPRAVARVARWVDQGDLHQGVGINADCLVMRDEDPRYAAAVDEADLVLADGMSVVWWSRLRGRPLPARVPAIDLFEALLPVAAAAGWPIYLLGARPEALAEAREALTQRYAGLQIAGFHDGYYRDDEAAQVAADIASSGARLLFVGMSSPRKELFVAQHREALAGLAFVLGVGGALDIAAGRIRRAPRLVQRLGGEWLWRLGQEPRRLGRRYLHDRRLIRLALRELRG